MKPDFYRLHVTCPKGHSVILQVQRDKLWQLPMLVEPPEGCGSCDELAAIGPSRRELRQLKRDLKRLERGGGAP